MFYNEESLKKSLLQYKNSIPFDHCVIDNFLEENAVKTIEKEFLAFDDQRWFYYKNPIEDKKALNDWNAFPEKTYKLFRELISTSFVDTLSHAIGIPLLQDPGLHGGGWHIHGPGGNLNPHQDYSIHPKIGLQRKLNLIIYVSSDLKEEHGGHLGLWSHNNEKNSPEKLVCEVQPKYNRAILFDTTQNSWHGISRPLVQPAGIYRKSLAIYYLTYPDSDANPRQRALFAARDSQKDDRFIEEMIKLRADPDKFHTVYRT